MKSSWLKSSSLVLGGVFVFGIHAAGAVWQEPTCDPTDTGNGGPSAAGCNISAPLNVSTAAQTKSGSITVNTGFVLGVSSLVTSPLTGGATLTLPGSIVIDDMVSNTLTSSKFVGSGSTSDAIDLGTAEINGTLSSGNVQDIWVNASGDTMSAALSTTAPALPYLLTVNPTALPTNTNAINITLPTTATSANSAGNGISMSGAVTGSLIYLNTKNNATFTGEGPALNIKVETDNALNGKGILVQSYAKSASAYAVDVVLDTTATAERAMSVTNNTTGSLNAFGIYANATNAAAGNLGVGVYAAAGGSGGASNLAGTPVGVYGYSAMTTNGIGVYGRVAGTNGVGVAGDVSAATGIAVRGVANHVSGGYGGTFQGTTLGVIGTDSTTFPLSLSGLPTKVGVYAESTAGGYGVYAKTNSTDPYKGAVYGTNSATTGYSNGGYFKGQIGVTGSSSVALNATDDYAYGVNGYTESSTAPAIHGYNGSTVTGGYGVWGESLAGIGVYGVSGSNIGIKGVSSAGTGVFGLSNDTLDSANNAAIKGSANNTYGVYGTSGTQTGIYGKSNGSGNGVQGESVSGPGGAFSSTGSIGVQGNGATYGGSFSSSDIGLYATGTTYAGKFNGTVLAKQFQPTSRPFSAELQQNSVAAGGTEILGTYEKTTSMVFDGSEVWVLNNDVDTDAGGPDTDTDDYIYKIDPKTLMVNDTIKYTDDTMGLFSKLIIIPDARDRGGIVFWDKNGNPYYMYKNAAVPVKVTGGTLVPGINAGVYSGGFYVGTANSSGNVFQYTTDLKNYTNIPGTWGKIIDVLATNEDNIYVLNNFGSSTAGTVSKVVYQVGSGTYAVTSYPLTYDATKQMPISMTYDGRYIWVVLESNTTHNGTVDRIDPATGVVTEMYLTDSDGVVQCTYPNGVVFDEVYLWITCKQVAPPSVGTSRIVLFSPADNRIVKPYALGNVYYKSIANAQALVDPIFDGTNIVLPIINSASTGSVRKIFSGHGDGQYGTVPFSNGVNLISQNGTLYCARLLDDSPGENVRFLFSRSLTSPDQAPCSNTYITN